MSALIVFANKIGCEAYEENTPDGPAWHTLTQGQRDRYTRSVTAVVGAMAHMTPNECVAILTAAREHHIGKVN